MQEKYEELKAKVQDQERKIQDVLIVPKRMEYKIDGLKSELKEEIELVKTYSKSELK